MDAQKESRRNKFVRIAEARTNKIINMIQLLGNCSNYGVYEYSEVDIDKIFNAIETELKETRKRFNKAEPKKTKQFTLE